jgi:inorganic pyrophosphatase
VKSPASRQLPAPDPDSGRVHVLIDTPAGSRNKFRFDTELGVFRVSRRLPAGLSFPCDFGSIPRTCADDGDALDVLVVGLEPTFPGCLVEARLIGILFAEQKESQRTVRNDRLIACGETAVNPAHYEELQQLGDQEVRALELFFETYNRAHGREFRIRGRGGAQEAREALRRAAAAFRKRR